MTPASLRCYWLKIWVTSQSRLDEVKKYGHSFRNGGSIGHTEVDADWRRNVIHKQGFERSAPRRLEWVDQHQRMVVDDLSCTVWWARRRDPPTHPSLPPCSRPSRTSPTGGPKDGPSLTATRHVGARMMWVGTEGWAPQGARTKGWGLTRRTIRCLGDLYDGNENGTIAFRDQKRRTSPSNTVIRLI